MKTNQHKNWKPRKLLSLFLVLTIVLSMLPNVVFAEGYRRYCECCGQWVNSEDICDLDDTIQHCTDCCEGGAAHCCICQEFDPDKICLEEPIPHCTDCCDERHCCASGCNPSENTIGDHVCSNCGWCDECTDAAFGMHECEICGDCLLGGGGDICFYHENGYHHEDCCGKRHCKNCNKCEEIEGVDICDDCGFCTDCAPEDEHFCEFCGECMYSTVNKCGLDEHHCMDCCEHEELHCAECGEFDESKDCPDCEFCTDCVGDNGSDAHFSEISGECLNAEGACEHGLPITEAECEELLCEECGQHFEYEVEACETCLDEGVQRCTDCCQNDSDYDTEHNLCPYSPEYQEYLCPICDIHANDTSLGKLCPECGLCEECCLEQVSNDPGHANLCSTDFHCDHFCTLDNQCKEYCDATSKCHGTVCTHAHTGAYAHDETIHWKICSDCNAKVSIGKHDFEWVEVNTANHTAKQRCTECGYTTAAQPYHVHTFGDWEISTQYHTRRCTVAGCTKTEKEAHTFVGNTCSVCGFTKTDEIVVEKAPEKLYLPADITAQELLDMFAFRVAADYYLPLQYTWTLALPDSKYISVIGDGTRFTLTGSHTTTSGASITTDAQRLELAQDIIDALKGENGTAECEDDITVTLRMQSGSVEKNLQTRLQFEHTDIYAERQYVDRHLICCRDCGIVIGEEDHNFDRFGRCVDCGYTKTIKITKQPKDIKRENDGSRYYSFAVEAEGASLKYQWFGSEHNVINLLEGETSPTLTVEIDPSEVCKDGAVYSYYCKVYNDDHEIYSDTAWLTMKHHYELKDYNGVHHAKTCEYCGYVDPNSIAAKSRHDYEHSVVYGENRYDIIVNDNSRFYLTEKLLKDSSDNPVMQQIYIDLFCGPEETGNYWHGVLNKEVSEHSTSVCVDCGYIWESDGTYDGPMYESLGVSAKDCDFYKTHKYHSSYSYCNDTIHWRGCYHCNYVEPGSVALHDMKPKSSDILEEDGKYYRIDSMECEECGYCETTKTEITKEEATMKDKVTGSFIAGGAYFSPVATITYDLTETSRTHTLKDVPSDKRLTGYTLYFVGDGKADEKVVYNSFVSGDSQGTYAIPSITIACEKIPGDGKNDYKFIMNCTNSAYQTRDFKVVASFVDATIIYAEDGTLYKTNDNTPGGTKNWEGDQVELFVGDVVYFKADAVTSPKELTGISKLTSDGEIATRLKMIPVVPGQFDLYSLEAPWYLFGAVTIKSTYAVNNGKTYTVGFDHDNNPATPAIDLPEGPFAEGTELAIPNSMKYYGTPPTGEYFSHWACEQLGGGMYLENETFQVVDENMVFTPVYSALPPKTIVIAYHDNMADVVVDVPSSVDIYAGQTYTITTAVPVLDGYRFKGWSTKAWVTTMDTKTPAMYQPGTEVKVSDKNNFVVFYAVWEKRTSSGSSGSGSGTGSGTATAGWKNPFMDVHAGDWFYDGVAYVHQNGLMEGTELTIFSPLENTTRSMVWTVLARMEKIDLTGGDLWYSKAQEWAMKKGVSDGTDPDDLITREQFVTMLWRNEGSPVLAGYTGLAIFTDLNQLADYAELAMVWAHAEGIIQGEPDNTLNPKGAMTRAEMAVILQRYLSAP